MGTQSQHEDRLNAFFECLQDELASLKPSTPSGVFAINRLSARARKRAEYVDSSLHDKAINSFIETNNRVRTVRINHEDPVIRDARYFILNVLERYTKQIDPDSIQSTLDLSVVFDQWRYGPGTSNGIRGTHAADKIYKDMTCTALAEPLVLKLRTTNPYFVSFDANRRSSGTCLVSGSRLATVPKNRDTMRTIAIEPVGNMCLQLAAGRYLEDALRSIGLDISRQQELNKLLAHKGSTDNSLATIDLSSASDMISLDLVRALMPPIWFRLLCHLRSQQIDVPGSGWVQLYMMSTMGNGFTFPLMTLILTALIYGYRAQRGGPNLFIDWSNTAVFGDDIIIPTSEYEGFCDVLVQAGLVVNYDKSYSAGPFRESCGGDYYEGVDVTPFYVRSLRNPSDIYVAMNQVLEWCGKHSYALLRTLLLLRSFLDNKVLLVPEWYSDSSGVRTALCSRRFTYLSTTVPRRRLTNDFFLVPLAIGGYVSSSGPDVYYTPRPKAVKCVVRKSRLPRGYLDGRDPLSRVTSSTTWISTLVDFLVA